MSMLRREARVLSVRPKLIILSVKRAKKGALQILGNALSLKTPSRIGIYKGGLDQGKLGRLW